MINFLNKVFRYGKTEDIPKVFNGTDMLIFDISKKQLMLDLNGQRNLIGQDIYEENQEILIGRVGNNLLYRKMVVISDMAPFNGTGDEVFSIPHGIENIDHIIDTNAYFTRRENGSGAFAYRHKLPYFDSTISESGEIHTNLLSANSTDFRFFNRNGINWSSTETLMTELVVIVEYTKHESEPVTPEVTE